MRKALSLALLLTAFSVILTACGTPRDPMDVNVFREVMEAEGYEVVDVSATPHYIDQNAYHHLAASTENYAFVFGEFIEERYAVNAFNNLRTNIESNRGATAAHRSVSLPSYGIFEQTSGGEFSYVYRVGNTLLYVTADSSNRERVRELIDKITE